MAKIEEKMEVLHNKPSNIRNISIIAHIHHGKTALTDSLIAGAGMLSMEKAGEAMKTWTLDEERERNITIQSIGVSMVHEYENTPYLINLIDTPGHVDFGGEVTRALRAVDGAVVLICAVEGVMPQTEIVLRQAIKERVKPVLFINKVDRLLAELQITPEQMQQRFLKTIADFNNMVHELCPEEFKDKWMGNVNDGSVAFGSAIDRWALSIPIMKKTGISFADVIEAYKGSQEEIKEKLRKLSEKAPLYQVVLDMAVKHLPNPIEAQGYRIHKLWHGDIESKAGQSLLKCDKDGPLCFVVTKVTIDPNAGEISFGRVFSGTLRRGDDVKLINSNTVTKLQQIFTTFCDKRISADVIPAGNTAAVIGLKNSTSGETVSSEDIEPFEKITHIFDPVMTKAIEPKNPQDLPKLVQALKEIAKEDPTIVVLINEETGENLILGLGELHLEWTEQKIKHYKHVDVKTSEPIIIYRESVKTKGPEFEGKSPNKHNKFYMTVEPLDQGVYEAMISGEIGDMKIRKKDKDTWQVLEKLGLDKDEARGAKMIHNKNLLIDMTSGQVHIGEVIEMVMEGTKQALDGGPLAREPVTGVKVKLMDMKLHEDSIHRGPAQVIPAVRSSVRGSMLNAKPMLLEPVQTMRLDAPLNFIGELTKLVQSRRGRIIDMDQTEERVVMRVKVPVSSSFGFISDLRSATEGRGTQSLMNSRFEELPRELQDSAIKKIRDRKGLKIEQEETEQE